jgi:hypothetical protein
MTCFVAPKKLRSSFSATRANVAKFITLPRRVVSRRFVSAQCFARANRHCFDGLQIRNPKMEKPMSDYDVTITSVSIINKPKPWTNGDVVRAFFTVETRGFWIQNCLLVQRPRTRGWIALMPRRHVENGQRVVGCNDQQLIDTMTSAAKRAYEALGGKL